MRCLSIRAPWWWFILHSDKDIENRDWLCKHRGPLLVHASKWWKIQEIYDDAQFCRSAEQADSRPVIAANLRLLGGHIVGVVDMVDCVTESDSPWFFGRYGFVLKNPRPIQAVPWKGRLGLFDVPDEVWQGASFNGSER